MKEKRDGNGRVKYGLFIFPGSASPNQYTHHIFLFFFSPLQHILTGFLYRFSNHSLRQARNEIHFQIRVVNAWQ